jgi:hypothetical protein
MPVIGLMVLAFVDTSVKGYKVSYRWGDILFVYLSALRLCCGIIVIFVLRLASKIALLRYFCIEL